MEILMVRLDFRDGLENEYILYGINKHQMSAAEDAVKRAQSLFKSRIEGETFEDVLDFEFRKAGIRFKPQGFRVETVYL